MVPAALPAPGILVTITGLFEIAGAIGLLLPHTARRCELSRTAPHRALPRKRARGPAWFHNPRAPGHEGPVRGAIQAVFIAALVAAVMLNS